MPDAPLAAADRPATSDRRLLLLTGGAVVLAAALFVGILLVATRHGAGTSKVKPLFIGLSQQLNAAIRDQGPRYEANPFGGHGFWLDREDGKLVALVLDRPGAKDCVVNWKDQRHAYIDCNDQELQHRQLDRYQLTTGSRGGSPTGSVFIDLRKVLPAPDPIAGG